jgi:hypothetical protein
MRRKGTGGAMNGRRRLAAGLLGLAMLLGGALGCGLADRKKEEPAKVMPREEPALALEVGETATFEFKADGVWYPAPIMILRDQRVRVELGDQSAFIPDSIVRYRIGTLEQVVISPPRDFIVTRPGAMYFFYDPVRGRGFEGEIEVVVTRVR